LKKSEEEVLEAVATALDIEVEELEENEEVWSEVARTIAETQGITLVVKEGEEMDVFGTGATVVTVEKSGDSYKIVKSKGVDTAAKKRIAQRMRCSFSDGCRVLLGLEAVDGADVDGAVDRAVDGADVGNMVLTRLTMEVQDEDWEKRRLEWVAFYEKLGRSPNSNSKDTSERRAGQWQCDQRKYYKKKAFRMRPLRIKLLEETPGWKWEEEDTWEQNRQHWIDQYQTFGKCPLNSRAFSWQSNQRTYYKTKKMSEERIEILNQTHGWHWGLDDMWEQNRQHWIAQYQKIGKCPKFVSNDINETKAGKWQSHQRDSFKKKEPRMTNERIQILNNTPGWKWEEEDTWEPNRQNWIVQFQKLGRTPLSASVNIDEKQSNYWMGTQRQDYKKGKLSEERIQILNNTSGWCWGIDDMWEQNRHHWIIQYQKIGKSPSNKSKNADEKKAGAWRGTQCADYKNKKTSMTPERIQLLNNTPGWIWEEEDTWEPNRQHWISQYHKLGKTPSSVSKDPDEKKAGKWQSHQRDDFKKKESRMTPERIHILNNTPGWSWESKSAKQTERSRKPLAFPTESESNSKSNRTPSQLEEYHKRFKTMNANTYKSTITTEEFAEYHKIADAYDAKDPTERQPIHKIATMLAKYNKPSYAAIDLGCGKNRLRYHEAVSRMTWTSVDVHATDETVQIADMSQLPYDDETYDVAILSRSLWARNHMDVLAETFRILKSGAKVFVAESYRRWMVVGGAGDTYINSLIQDLKDTGFEIVSEEGTRETDQVADVFQYIVCRKA
jgi:hypothetical protein